MNTVTDIKTEIANTIREQLTGKTLYMLGVQQETAFTGETGHGFRFRIRGSRRVNCITIELDEGRDLYAVTFWKLATCNARKVSSFDQIEVSELHGLIERETGLYTSL